MKRAATHLLLTLAILAACGHAEPSTRSAPHPATAATAATAPTGAARSRAAFERALADYEGSVYRVADRRPLAAEVDRLAAQRYATVSGLYWHTDLDAARAAAAASGRPILALRMLGRLDQDLSCANSRFFRVALYANQAVSSYLREHFELVWTSERPVPVARVDFGDGRVLERTIAGNSAHYVLDSRGRPVDALPGLYSPALFMAALEAAEAVARDAADLDDDAQADRVRRFHQSWLAARTAAWTRFGTIVVPAAGDTLEAAETRAMSKAMIERPMVQQLTLGRELPLGDRRLADQTAVAWTAIAAKLPAATLDPRSRALFAALSPTDWARAGQPLPAAGVGDLVRSFETILARDAAFNEYYLHQQIGAWFASGDAPRDLAGLNARVYAELFLTPATDPWLGMATPGAFTGLPADGVLVDQPTAPSAEMAAR